MFPSPQLRPDMKDVSNTASKHARLAVYPRKRPIPVRDRAVAKSRRFSPRRTPRAPELQRIRDAQLLSRVRDSRLLELDYPYDILRYMHGMEVRPHPSPRAATHPTQQCTMSAASWTSSLEHDFLVEVPLTFRLRPQTLYLTLNIVDRYVSLANPYVL
ncbi:hypothetical protein JB92DRAFT_3110223 [Gautieria morchelliformis]|nr:hypothetical protein JB92DRAFT_3110223 [Gautieria morchelliformis]